MKLIIELSNGTVYGVKKKDRFTWGTLDELKEAIKKGKPLQAELEKTKKKIKNDCILHEEWFVGIDDLEKCLGRIDTIVDKEISELKGENK